MANTQHTEVLNSQRKMIGSVLLIAHKYLTTISLIPIQANQ